MRRIFMNACKYNWRPDHEIHKAARERFAAPHAGPHRPPGTTQMLLSLSTAWLSRNLTVV